MHVTFNQLKIFREVACQQSVTKAAKQLYMSQPAVSIQLKQLEEQVGLPLIEVVGKQLYLTEIGMIVLESAKKIKDELQFLRDTIAEYKGGMQGELKVSAVTTAQHFVPHLLGAFHRQYPAIQMSLKIRNRESVLKRLYANHDDLAILSQLPENLKQLVANPILEDQLVVVTSVAFKPKQLSIHDLQAEPWVVRETGSGTRMSMERFFEAQCFEPKIAMELGSTEAIIEAVSAGIGTSILPRSSLPTDLLAKDLKLLNLKEALPEHIWFAVHLKDKKLSPASRNFLKSMMQCTQEN